MTVPGRNHLIRTFPVYFNEYEVSLDIKPTGHVNSGWENIFRVTKGSDTVSIGDRLPAIWFLPFTKRLYICTAINFNKSHCFDGGYNLPFSVFTNVKIQQQRLSDNSYQYSIKINGVTRHEINNTNPVILYNAKVYLGDPWYNPAKAQIKNLIVKSEPTGMVNLFSLCLRRYFSVNLSIVVSCLEAGITFINL